MKYKTQINKTLIVLLAIFSLQLNAATIEDATWYLSVDIDKLQNNEAFKVLKEDKSEKISEVIGELQNVISHVTLYGNSKGSEDATAVIMGDFSSQTLADSVLDLIYSKVKDKDISNKISERTFEYNNHTIQVIIIQESSRNKEIFFSTINDHQTVVGFKLDEVKNWIDDKYDDIDIDNDSLFSVVVNVESALAHMAMNLGENNQMMNSELFHKVEQISASINENSGDIIIDVALSTKSEETATQIEQVINGLIAMANLSNSNDKNQLLKELINNVSIVKNNNNILINTFIAIDLLKEYKLKKHNSDDMSIEINL